MPHRRTIVSHVSWDAFEPGVRHALRALDYDIVPAGEARTAAELRIVDDEILERLDDKVATSSPLLLLGGARSDRRPAGPRGVEVLRQPVKLQELYAAPQTTLEETPRRAPRVATVFEARCAYGQQFCAGAVVTLSECGCLFRCNREPPRGQAAVVHFRLAGGGPIKVLAQTAHRRGSNLGLAFVDLDFGARSAIARYVTDQLIMTLATRYDGGTGEKRSA